MTWADRPAALGDLKAAHMPSETDDYELAEYRPGSWQLLARDAPPAEPEPVPEPPVIREDRVLANLRKKPGARPRGEATVIAQAVPARIKPNGRKTPRPPAKAQPRPRPAVIADAPAMLDWPEVEPEASETVELPADNAEVATIEVVKAGSDSLFTPLPKEGQPYRLVIVEGAVGFPRHSAHTSALALSRKLKTVVTVEDADGLAVRVYDHDAITRQQKAAKVPGKAGRPVGAKGKQAVGESKFTRAARLLFRENGATASELEKACGWDKVTLRYINRASRFNDNAKIEILGEAHWRLVARK